MKISEPTKAAIKPAIWGVVGGAAAAMIIGFVWGGWVTGGTAEQMERASADSAVVQALTPLCVVRAEQDPDQVMVLKETSSWQRSDFVIKAGWVSTVSDQYRAAVARACAATIVEALAPPSS